MAMVTTTAPLLLGVLSLQAGLQPLLAQRFAGPTTSKTVVVLLTELTKGCLAAACILALRCHSGGGWSRQRWHTSSSLRRRLAESLVVAGVPAAVYALQNVLVQVAVTHLDPLLFHLLSQTKLLSTALCLRLFLSVRQTPRQLAAIAMVLAAALVLVAPAVAGAGSGEESAGRGAELLGLACVAGASLCSGVGAAYSQWVLQNQRRDSLVYSLELSVFGAAALMIKVGNRHVIATSLTRHRHVTDTSLTRHWHVDLLSSRPSWRWRVRRLGSCPRARAAARARRRCGSGGPCGRRCPSRT